jgi:hypothetical protein
MRSVFSPLPMGASLAHASARWRMRLRDNARLGFAKHTRDRWLSHTPKEGFEMSASSASHVSGVLRVTPTLTRLLDTVARQWRWLTDSLFDPYRPELHYMRGPGPKSREKHARGAGR